MNFPINQEQPRDIDLTSQNPFTDDNEVVIAIARLASKE